MDKNELARRLMATFLEEVHDHVGSMNQELLELEKSGSDDSNAIKQLFRSAHSLKGASRAVNVPAIESICHKMEDIFGAIRDGDCEVSSDLTSLLLRGVDCIEASAALLQTEQPLDEASIQEVVDALTTLTDGEASDATVSPEEVPQLDVSPTAPTEDGIERPATAEPSPPQPTQRTFAPEPPSPAPTPPSRSVAATIRVPAEKLDALLAQSGEVLIARSRVDYRREDAVSLRTKAAALKKEWEQLERLLNQKRDVPDSVTLGELKTSQTAEALGQARESLRDLTRNVDQLISGMASDSRLLSQTCSALDSEVYRARMLPFAEACVGLERAVRDIARATNKEVELVIEGADVEVDRSVLEGLKDPLMHIVRNAVDHGIESPHERAQRGKPTLAHVNVTAALRGGQVEVVVRDDGQGLDLSRICDKARERGLSVPESAREQARLIFAPGFSTAAIVTDVSGRGVGLDVVQTQIESLHGAVDVTFDETGTQFTLTVPLTLTTIRSMLASVAGQVFAFPTSSVSQVVRFRADEMKQVSGSDTFVHQGKPVSVVPLGSILGIEQRVAKKRDDKLLGLALRSNEQTLIVVVDEVLAEQDVLVKNLGRRIRRVRQFAGATLLPSGRVALVVNVPNMIRSAFNVARRTPTQTKERRVEKPKRLLVVDDSVTTRTLMKSILETAGYVVASAADGQQAWETLQTASFDLVVSDVDMPRMNGFELTETIRAGDELAELPVILVTARGSDEDKMRGVEVGANAYIEKSAFDQRNLIEIVKQLV